MKPMMEITDPQEQQAVVDGFGEFFVRYTQNPLLALLFVVLKLEWLFKQIFMPVSAATALLALFTSAGAVAAPYWIGVMAVTTGLDLLKKPVYRIFFRQVRAYAGFRTVEEYFNLRGRLNDQLKQHLDNYNRTGQAVPKQPLNEIYGAYRQWSKATGRKDLVFVAMGLTVPSAAALAGYYVMLPAGILMVIYHAPFFETIFWWALAITCIGYFLVAGLLRLLQFQMKRHHAS
jgi:hypothetical protein